MISAQIKAGVDSRFSEVRKLFAHIQNLDSKAATDQDSVSAESATILRGLIFVHLYGAFEYAVTLSVQVLLQEITKVAVPYCEFEHLFHAIALDSDFKSVSDSGWKGKWPNGGRCFSGKFQLRSVLSTTLFFTINFRIFGTKH